jgi:hypothetical protein
MNSNQSVNFLDKLKLPKLQEGAFSKKNWIKNIFKGLGLSIWFIFFVLFVRPKIGEKVMPYLIKFSHAQASSAQGIDLDPIRVADSEIQTDSSSSIYSSRFGYGDSNIYGDVETSDTRVIAMSRFLNNYNSPMAPYAKVFVESADEVGLDWRLVASISGVESGFGRITPYESKNAWGWRGGPGGDFSDFPTWEDGIRHVTSRIAIGYGTDITPHSMESIYCPPCGEVPSHPWANGVAGYMSELSEYRSNL